MADLNRLAARIVEEATDEQPKKSKSAQAEAGRKGGQKGGKARAEKLWRKCAGKQHLFELALAASAARSQLVSGFDRVGGTFYGGFDSGLDVSRTDHRALIRYGALRGMQREAVRVVESATPTSTSVTSTE
jgi:hypothetical protein